MHGNAEGKNNKGLDNPMKLIYRGVTYDYNPTNGAARHSFQPTHHTSKSTYELIYRGNTYQVDPNAIAKASVQPVTYELIYRGITYSVNRNEQGRVTAIAPICKPLKN
jgi:Domain of unknown function (DUF4278)